MNIKEAGTSRTIDSKGNIVPKPTGPSRWASPRKYACKHVGCNRAAVTLSSVGRAHNCCGTHHGKGA
jgi:hypothetical protein